jgi:predicted AAA+ superfamily ATPase
MAKTNRDRVAEGLTLLSEGMYPFVEREMKAVYGKGWEVEANNVMAPPGGGDKKLNWEDPQTVLNVMFFRWNEVFKNTLGQAERSLVGELRTVRNSWAHMENFTTDDTYRALDTAGRLLTAVSAKEADEIEKKKNELLRLRFEEQRRSEARKAAPVMGQPSGNLKPWREVITPHPDVASGRYQQAEFAADLWQVYLGEGSDEYRDPTQFFHRTFLTGGLQQLLTNAIQRLGGAGGDPVVELQTNFGGGKTHSQLALFHLFSGTPASELPGIENLLKEAGATVPSGVRRAVFVGTKISPGQVHKKPDGTKVRTLWGEIAWQLGGKDGYKLVKEADETSTNPGDSLRELFNRYAPCLILIDEWVAYARQLHQENGLPAGNFETQFTFAQTLTEAARAAKDTMVVVSIPASESPSPHDGREKVTDIEVGGERGRAALSKLKNAIGRVEASWRPASAEEGFEIVRRRLFEPITDSSLHVELDQVTRAFSDMYGSQQQEFPSSCREADYMRRMKAAYPIHPELFDRLFEDWSTLEKFQRTRGVLRLMAAVINSLWERQDNSLLIMPASVALEDQRVGFELKRYLEEGWDAVIEKDVDGQNSLPMELDRENPNLGRYSACRRVARAIYMGSAPVQRAANRGVDERQVKLGCVQPGETVATFGDALRRLSDRATYLYVDGHRYWYSTQPTVNRLAEDRAIQLHEGDVAEEISRRLRKQANTRGDFAKVHACAPSGDIPNETEARLVILGPEHPHTGKEKGSPALIEAAVILESRGNSPRTYRNTLVFLAPDATRLQDLEAAARQYLAWQSIHNDREELNLDAFQRSQADSKYQSADSTVEARIPETYLWLLVPEQADPTGSIEWSETRQQGQDPLAVRVSKKLKNEELLMVQLGGIRLRHELDRIPLWRGDHVGIKQLLDDFATYLYLPRLRSEEVLIDAIGDGVGSLTWETDTFAYAEAWDEKNKRYKGLVAGQRARVLAENDTVVVKPDVAARQMKAEAPPELPPGPEPPGPGPGPIDVHPPGPEIIEEIARRFHGAVRLDPLRMSRDVGSIADEVVQHLTSLIGSDIQVTLEIQATIPDGVPEKTIRDVTENCRTLKFDDYGFEEE